MSPSQAELEFLRTSVEAEPLDADLLRKLQVQKFDPAQPRDPAGTSTGGQWSKVQGWTKVPDVFGNVSGAGNPDLMDQSTARNLSSEVGRLRSKVSEREQKAIDQIKFGSIPLNQIHHLLGQAEARKVPAQQIGKPSPVEYHVRYNDILLRDKRLLEQMAGVRDYVMIHEVGHIIDFKEEIGRGVDIADRAETWFVESLEAQKKLIDERTPEGTHAQKVLAYVHDVWSKSMTANAGRVELTADIYAYLRGSSTVRGIPRAAFRQIFPKTLKIYTDEFKRWMPDFEPIEHLGKAEMNLSAISGWWQGYTMGLNDELVEMVQKFNANQPRTPKGVAWQATGPGPGRWVKLDAYSPRPAFSDKDFNTWTPEEHTQFQAYMDQGRAWQDSMRHNVTLGLISPEEAEKLGWRKDDIYSELPKKLYHVTTNAPAVQSEGLKTRQELQQRSGYGLGGGPSDTVSFTNDLKIAESIQDAMLLAHDFLNDKVTLRDLIRMAEAGTDAEGPWMGDLRLAYRRESGEGLSRLDDLEDQVVRAPWHDDFDHSFYKDRWLKDHSPYNEESPPWHDAGPHPLKEGWRVRERSMTPTEVTEAKTQFLKRWLAYREQRKGPMDPLFFGSDLVALSKQPRSNIRIMEFEPANEHVLGTVAEGLAEYRTVSGEHVNLKRIVKFDPSQPRHPKGHPEGGRWSKGQGTMPSNFTSKEFKDWADKEWKAGRGLIARGISGSFPDEGVPIEVAQRIENGTATVEDVLQVVNIKDSGIFWYGMNHGTEGGWVEDAEEFGYNEDGPGSHWWNERMREPEDGKVLFSGTGVVLIAERPKGWTSEDNPDDGLMGNSYIDTDKWKSTRLVGVHYQSRDNQWIDLPVKGDLIVNFVTEEIEKFDPAQPRHPKGVREGGRWSKTRGGSLWASTAADPQYEKFTGFVNNFSISLERDFKPEALLAATRNRFEYLRTFVDLVASPGSGFDAYAAPYQQALSEAKAVREARRLEWVAAWGDKGLTTANNEQEAIAYFENVLETELRFPPLHSKGGTTSQMWAVPATAQTLKELKDKGWGMPRGVDMGMWWHEGLTPGISHSTQLIAMYTGFDMLHINAPMFRDLPHLEAAANDDSFLVSSTQKLGLRGVILHEMIHRRDSQDQDGRPSHGDIDAIRGIEWSKRRINAAQSPSVYSMSNASDFVAEVGVAMYLGSPLSPEALDLYKKLDGPKI